MGSTLYSTGRAFGHFCFHTFGRVQVEGDIPSSKPLIVVANHTSWADPVLLAMTFPYQLHFFAKQELFNPLTKYLWKGINTHPLDRSLGVGALRLALKLLGQGYSVAMFPEGHHIRKPILREGHGGVAYLALKSGTPILPIGIVGSYKIPAWRLVLPLCKIRVKIGEPFSLPPPEGKLNRKLVSQDRDTIMERIAQLLPPEY